MPAVVAPTRCLVLWFPDWPVTAWQRAEDVPAAGPLAIVEANQVLACSAAAHAEGVHAGQRRREAQSRCPDLTVVAADPVRDERQFAPLVDRVEQVAPGVQVIRPGLATLRVRGPARYYGGEPQAAAAVLGSVGELGIPDGRAGIADGIFTAEQAAYDADPVLVVPPGAAADYLARCRSAGWATPTWSGCCPGWGSAGSATSRRWTRAASATGSASAVCGCTPWPAGWTRVR